MKTPHKHADLIKAWADGADIQYKSDSSIWIDVTEPAWVDLREYRIKPEPKDDLVLYCYANAGSVKPMTNRRFTSDNLRLTFDCATRTLKSAEVLK